MRVLLAALAATAGARPPAPQKWRGGSVAPQKPPPAPKTLRPPNEDTTTPLERQLLEKVRVYARGLDEYVKPEKVVKKALAGAAALARSDAQRALESPGAQPGTSRGAFFSSQSKDARSRARRTARSRAS